MSVARQGSKLHNALRDAQWTAQMRGAFEAADALEVVRPFVEEIERERDEVAKAHGDKTARLLVVQNERDELLRYIDEAKAACGGERMTGEPLAQAMKRVVEERDELRKTLEAVRACLNMRSCSGCAEKIDAALASVAE